MTTRQSFTLKAPRHFLAAVACLAVPLLALSQTPQAPQTPQTVPAQASVSLESEMVIVVRHAEKATDDPVDPTLSAAGLKRAEALADALANAGVGAIVTTHLKRTQATTAPLASKLGIKPVVLVVKRGETAAHIADVVAAVNAARATKKGAVLVVGHSNTVPLIVKALSGVTVANICESQHADVFILSIANPRLMDSPTARLIKSKYGDADPPVTAECK
jgi:broad specificity phosphatase PhoE